MDQQPSRIGNKVILIWIASIVAVALSTYFAIKSAGVNVRLEDVLTDMGKKNVIVARMRINLLKSVELEKSAVMAVTDEESQRYAEQSIKAASDVESDIQFLDSLIQVSGTGEEKNLIKEFRTDWKEFRKTDTTLLHFAVQNTNLKAEDLSYTKSAEALKRFETALATVIQANVSSRDEAAVSKHAYQAIIAALKISNLQAPHISESSDEKMAGIEALMKAEEEKVTASLKALPDLIQGRGKAPLEEAKTAFSDFMKINSEIITLSRQNSNVKSMELSLGQKRKMTAKCEDDLNSLQELIRDRNFKATK